MTAINVIVYDTIRKVTIGTSDHKENFTKALSNLAIPKSPNQQDKVNPDNNYNTKTLDILGKLEYRLTITGYLSTGLSDTTLLPGLSESNNAIDKRRDLRRMFFQGGVFSVLFLDEPAWSCNCDKLEITKVPNDDNNNIDGLAEYEVSMSLILVVGNLIG